MKRVILVERFNNDPQMRAFLDTLDRSFEAATGKKSPKITQCIRDNNIKELLWR